MAYQTKDVFELMRKVSTVRIRTLQVDGGASVDDILMQFQADLLGIPIKRPKQLDSTVWGVAQLAGVVAGIWTAADLKVMQQEDRVFVPHMAKSLVNKMYSGWQDAVKRAF